ncbi:hypothetical protein B0H11DRAFT_1753221 [Mycena galericulata]|nr:hypothetical protein B0H11DRAFT_1753221 [Mycena galericulata]
MSSQEPIEESGKKPHDAEATTPANGKLTFPHWTSLTEIEKEWAHFQPFLEDCGYMLRPRYRPGWVPKMLYSDLLPGKVEDSILAYGRVLDATRISDGVQVALKMVEMASTERAIAAFLAQERGAEKHTLPPLEVIPMNENPKWGFLVTSCMRRCDDLPYFATVSDVRLFPYITDSTISQGLVFLHEKNIAHRDICAENIVVDPCNMIPGGAHFLRPCCASNGVDFLGKYPGHVPTPHVMKTRTEAGPMNYYYIDFGTAVHFPSFEARTLVNDEVRRYGDYIPEIYDKAPYDPFKIDVWLVGAMLGHEFLLEYTVLDLMIPFVKELLLNSPGRRGSAGTISTPHVGD